MNHLAIPVVPAVAPVDLTDLLGRIGVQRPYFAFQDLFSTNAGTLTTRVRPEQPTGTEHEAICAAEAGRHLAILGLCAVAQRRKDTGRHYYLVKKAKLTRVAPKLRCPEPAGGFFGAAQALQIDKRTATAHATLSGGDGIRLFEATIDYQVLPEKLFHRMFRRTTGSSERRPSLENPYTSALPLGNVVCNGGTLTGTLGPLSAADCAGHFPGCPAVPVAILMDGLARAAGQLLSDVLDTPHSPYVVLNAKVEAEHLAAATDLIELQIDNHRQTQRKHHFTCLATTGEATIGRMELTLYPLGT